MPICPQRSLKVSGTGASSSFCFKRIDFGLHLCAQTPHPIHKSASTTTAFLNLLVALVENPEKVAHWEYRKVHKDGSVLWVKETARIVQDTGGNTVVLIEHNMEIIKEADYVIDLGPEGGDGGGSIVTAGSPAEILADPEESYTAKYLEKYLKS